MRIIEVLNENSAEFIPRANAASQTIENIADQLVRTAYVKGGGKPAAVRKIAQQMANAFGSKLAEAVDRELNYNQMKNVDARV